METELPQFTIRHYAPDDYPMLKSWWEDHGDEAMDATMIPASTCLVLLDGEPCASGSVFPCNNNHVAFFHGLVTRPDLTFAEACGALRALQAGLDIIMRAGGHTLLLGTVQQGAMVRGAKMMGFTPLGYPVQGVARLVQPPTEHTDGN